MIAVQQTAARDAIDLAGIWSLHLAGDAAPEGPALAIAVPGSWNEQLAEAGLMNHTGAVWLSRRVWVPPHAAGRRLALRFGSADYQADVYWNGALAGHSGALKLPFELAVTAEPGSWNDLAVKIAAELPDDAPMQRVRPADYAAEGRPKDEYHPAVRFDFFPFGGLNRNVHLLMTPHARITGWRVITELDGDDGVITVKAFVTAGISKVALRAPVLAEADVEDGTAELRFRLPGVRRWCPADPHLYPLELAAGDDVVSGHFGVRTVQVAGNRLLLNGEPVTLTGFGRHEDSAIHGRGQNLPVLIKDLGLIRWTGGNSVRTAHYPHDEAFYDLADRTGLLVVDELFSVNLDFRKVTAQGLAAHKDAVSALIERDANHPSVIAWSLANEPGYLGEACYADASRPYWQALYEHARAADPTRPLTHANVAYAGADDPAYAHDDFLMINRYAGWYGLPGQLDAAAAALKAELDSLAAHGKPILVSEFGADALPGAHASHDQLFTEEYQAEFIRRYWQVIAAHPATIGGHVWTLADFRTAQHSRRVVMNLKGVFTRDRSPKRAAFVLRDLWGGT